MRKLPGRKNNNEDRMGKTRHAYHPVCIVLMVIGLLTVLYFAVVYIIIPLLALMTKGNG